MKISIHRSIDEIQPEQWNQLVEDRNPFLQHAFLSAAERHHCVGEAFGWIPCHLAIHEKGQLLAAMPLYQKHNNYGEFVFDQAWAQAWQRSGLNYYPKLVSAIPYTPATGQRMLTAPGREQQLRPILLQTAMELAQETGGSGLHLLFQDQREHQFTSQSMFTRHDCQFHWFNQTFKDFDDFLLTLKSKKRKNILQERRRVHRAGIRFRILDGHTATAEDWARFDLFYRRTFEEKWGIATFNQAFFEEVARKIPDQVVLVMADCGSDCIAGAMMYRSNTTLYGRHWGSTEEVEHLHFETCYYQGIQYCIAEGLSRFEPGAQGEHKVARGFVPTITRSSHWLCNDIYNDAIAQFCRHEHEAIEEYMRDLQQHLPYKKEFLP